MDFGTALRREIKSRPDVRRIVARRVLAVLDAKPSATRTRRLQRMELAAAGAVGLPVGKIDWGKIDWKKLFDAILSVLDAILPLLS